MRGGPLVAGNRVIQGVESFRVSQGSFVVAVDLDSGKEVWRFYTVARPGDPGGHTWNDLPLEQRNGGSVWVTPSYDPELGLVYFGPAPTYDTAPLLQRVEKEGVTNEPVWSVLHHGASRAGWPNHQARSTPPSHRERVSHSSGSDLAAGA